MKCDERLTGHGVALGTPDASIECGQLVRFSQEMEPFLQSVCTCHDVMGLSELLRLRLWHSHEKTIEIVARLVEDGDWNVRATVRNTMCSLAF